MKFIVELTNTYGNTVTGGTTPERLAEALQTDLNKDFSLVWGVSATVVPIPSA